MTDTGEPHHRPDSAASSVYHNDLIRSEITQAIHKDGDSISMIKFALSSKDGYDSSLRYLRRKVTHEQVKEWQCSPHCEQRNLESVHTLTVSKKSLHRVYRRDKVDVDGYLEPVFENHPALMGRRSNRTVSCDLKGLELMLNLKEISIECCPSEFWGIRGNVRVEMTELLRSEEGDRWVDVRTVLKDVGFIDWDEPMMEMRDFPISALKKLVIYPTTPPMHKQDQEDRTISALRSKHVDRLNDLRSLSILGAEITVKSLGLILLDCPEIETLDVDLCFAWVSWFPDEVLGYIKREHRLTDARIQGAELDWLPYLRRCKRLLLPFCRCHVGEQAFSPIPSLVARVAAECTVPINLEELMLDLIVTDIRTCTEADSVIEFIKINTTEQTRITITTSKDPRDSDSLGSPESELSELSDDSDDDNDSESNGHSADSEGSADGGQSNSSGNSADSEEMTPEQREEMKKAHKAILRYAASERARWS